ncbi:MAG TPA: hypothetical protein VKK79_17305 [Candidatus Lokiarchaeia archaeon]|nr:hypothetical protein [Candidatus Lokiarchaeia archaeon]
MNQASLVLDTTYVLPLFEIDVHLTTDFHEKLWELWKSGRQGYDICLPSTCLLESAYKLRRECRKQGDPTLARK